MGRRARVELRYNSPGAWIPLFGFLSCFLLLWYFALIKKKNILDFSVWFWLYRLIFFFLSRLYISWRIHCSVGVSWKGGTPLFGFIDGKVPLSRAWFSGSWSGIVYKSVKVGYKQSTFVIPTIFGQKIRFGQNVSLKITYFCMRNLLYSLFS